MNEAEYLKAANEALDDMAAHFAHTDCRGLYPAVGPRLRELRAQRPKPPAVPDTPPTDDAVALTRKGRIAALLVDMVPHALLFEKRGDELIAAIEAMIEEGR